MKQNLSSRDHWAPYGIMDPSDEVLREADREITERELMHEAIQTGRQTAIFQESEQRRNFSLGLRFRSSPRAENAKNRVPLAQSMNGAIRGRNAATTRALSGHPFDVEEKL